MAKSKGKVGSVGYCRPPIETRFRKGLSGNPKGRPRNSAPPVQADELSELLHGDVKVSVGSKVETLKYIDLILRQKMKVRSIGACRRLPVQSPERLGQARSSSG